MTKDVSASASGSINNGKIETTSANRKNITTPVIFLVSRLPRSKKTNEKCDVIENKKMVAGDGKVVAVYKLLGHNLVKGQFDKGINNK